MKKFDTRLFWLFFLLSLIATLLIGVKLTFPKPKTNPEIAETKPLQKIKVGPAEFLVEVADTPAKRTQGLSNRPYLSEKEGMLFIFGEKSYHPFWMKETLIPLDFIWIEDDEIVEITTNVRPEQYQPPKTLKPTKEINKVLELNAGTVQKFNLSLGQKVEF